MIKNIGVARLVVVIVLLLLNAGLLSAAYLYVQPETDKKGQTLRTTKGAVSAKYQEIVKLRQDFALLKDRLKEFTSLELSGFFDNQNKVAATVKGNELALKAGIIGDLAVESAQEVVDARATDAGHVLLKGPITMKVQAQDDVDVMYFLKLMQKQFPGVLQYQSIDLTRVKNLDAPVLRQIGNNVHATLVEADVVMDWYTMPDKEDLDEF